MLTPDQWGRIERLFEKVEQAPPEDRERLVYESGEEDSIRWEVLKMLLATANAGNNASLLDLDLRARPARLAYRPGDTLSEGRFRIDALIAEGGMGQVYRATDLELNAPVALKTVHRAFAADTHAVDQFKREVQLARSINHPNVCRIFDLERQGGELFLTMELLDGETLRSLLDRQGRLTEAEAWRIFEPVLGALEASHDRGVLHRDLKPSNIFLADQPEQRVVVTDFGIAARASAPGATEKNTNSISAGTPAYMAPEQFRRDQAFTASTDLYAAGILLYEMICGRGPFTATTPEQMEEQKSLNQAVPVRQWLPGVSRRWEKALQKAIQADPKLRFASAREFSAALRPPLSQKHLGWFAAAAAVVAAIALLATFSPWRTPDGVHTPLAIRKLTTDGGYSRQPTITPDGKTVVFASDRGISGVRSLWKVSSAGDTPPVQLTFDTVDSSQPALSPDGRWIVYRSELDGGALFVIPLEEDREGATPRLLVRGATRPRFSPDGKWVLYMTSPATGTQWPQVYAIPFAAPDGETEAKPLHVSNGFRDAHNPIWSEDGHYVLFCGTLVPTLPDQEHDWWLVPFAPGGSLRARKTGMLPALRRIPQVNPSNRSNEDLGVWKDGFVYYSSPQTDSSSIWRVPLSITSPMPVQSAAPQRLTYGPSQDLQPAIGGGKIVFSSGATNIDVWMLPLHANTGVPAGEPVRITETTDYEVSPTVEPASRTAVFTRVLGARRELLMMDVRDPAGLGEMRTISNTKEVNDNALWSRDGKWIAYRKSEDRFQRLAVMDRAGTSRRVVCDDCGLPTDWSPDQQYLLVEPGDAVPAVNRFEFATGKVVAWISHRDEGLRGARYSPDGRWIAFHAEASPMERRVYIAPNREQSTSADWIRIGTENFSDIPGVTPVDFQPSWSPDGNLLYWLSGRDGFRCIWAQSLDPVTKRPQGPPFTIRHFHKSRRTLLRQVSTRATQVGFRVYRDRAYFAMDEITGNIWIADLPR